MNPRSLILVLLVATGALAGCLGDDEKTTSAKTCDARYQALGGENVTYKAFRDEWTNAVGNWTDSDDDCFPDQFEVAAGTDPLDADSYPMPPEAPTGPKTTVVEADTGITAATPMRSFNNGGAFSTPITATEKHSGFILEATWNSNGQGTSDDLSLWVRDAASGNVADPTSIVNDAGPIATVTGTSPLRLELPVDMMEEGLEYNVLIRAAGPVGANVNQLVTIQIHEFIDVPFDPEYTAL